MPKDVNKINPNNPVKTGGAVTGGAFSTSYFNSDRDLSRSELNDTKDVTRYDETPDSMPFFNGNVTNTALKILDESAHLASLQVENPGASKAYLQFFDATGNITLGSNGPRLSYFVPPNGAFDTTWPNDAKVEFASGIYVAGTSTPTGNGAPASGLILNLTYSK